MAIGVKLVFTLEVDTHLHFIELGNNHVSVDTVTGCRIYGNRYIRGNQGISQETGYAAKAKDERTTGVECLWRTSTSQWDVDVGVLDGYPRIACMKLDANGRQYVCLL